MTTVELALQELMEAASRYHASLSGSATQAGEVLDAERYLLEAAINWAEAMR